MLILSNGLWRHKPCLTLKPSNLVTFKSSNPIKMPIYTDQLKRKVTIAESPKRIISLVPSQTELLVDLGLGDRIVGVTKFCVHPEGFKEKKQIIGGTKNFHFDKIDQLEPDLIIGNKEENYQEGIEKLAEKYPVWMSDIFDLSDAMEILGLEKSQEGLKQHSNWLI